MQKKLHHTHYLLFCFSLFLLFPFSQIVAGETESASTLKPETEESYHSSSAELLTLGYDNFFRRLFGSRSSRSKAEDKSRSQRHNSARPKRYSPPPTNSQNPESHGSRSGATKSSNLGVVRNIPKPPLYRSLRDQHQSLGFWEVGFAVATSHVISDVANNKGLAFGEFTDYHTTNYSVGGGIYGRYIMNDWFAMNLGMNFANLRAERTLTLENIEAYRFNNDIFEFFGKTELRLPMLSRTPFDLYGFVGIGVFFSDATIYDVNDRLITAQEDYSQVQPFIPFGGGFSVQITNTFKLGYELGWRNTIFHYLDGVKSDNTYDHYFLNSLKVGFTF
ncbi:MAG: hypothetical protein ACOCXV_00410 [Bacteroidota bacterium]